MSALRKLAGFALVLGVGTGCARLRPAATPTRAAVSAASCDTARAIAAERANLTGALEGIRAGASGAATNAYDAATRTPAVAVQAAATASQPGANATSASTTAAIRESQTSVAIWSAEAAHTDNQAAVVRDRVAQLDARAHTLPTVAACAAALPAGMPRS